jgi:hypothetical protein
MVSLRVGYTIIGKGEIQWILRLEDVIYDAHQSDPSWTDGHD